MALIIELGGEPVWNALEFSADEDSLPLDPSDSGGGIGQLTLTLMGIENPRRARGKLVQITDEINGVIQGTVATVGGDEDSLTLGIYSGLYPLTLERTLAPFAGTLGELLTYYFSSVGIVAGVIIDNAVKDLPVIVIGWEGVVWDGIKQIAAAYKLDISAVGDNIVVRPVRKYIANNEDEIASSWSDSDTSRAEYVDVTYYNTERIVNGLLHPFDGSFESARVETVDAGATITIEVPTTLDGKGVSIESVSQPVAIDSKIVDFSGSGTYSVLDKDGVAVLASTWVSGGGSVKVGIGPDRQSLIISITGMRNITRSPYTLSIGETERYSELSTLVIKGTGLFYDKRVLTIPTGNDPDATVDEQGASVDNMFINTLADAAIIGAWAAAKYTAGVPKLDITALSVNRTGPSNDFSYPNIIDFNLANSGTVGEWNTVWTGKTVADFNAYQAATVADIFENQIYGNISGSRVYNDEAWYRIRSANISDEGVSYSADMDTTVKDFNTIWDETPTTVAQFNALMVGVSAGDFSAYPMRKGLNND